MIRKLGVAYDGQGRYADADTQFKRALEINTKAFGPDHRFIATVLLSQGELFEHQRRYDDAEQAYKRALAINEKARGPNHPDTARTLNHLAALSVVQGKPANAVAYSRKATAAVLAHANLGDQAGRQARDGDGLIEQRSGFFVNARGQPGGGRPRAHRARAGAGPRGVRNRAMGEPIVGRGRRPATGPRASPAATMRSPRWCVRIRTSPPTVRDRDESAGRSTGQPGGAIQSGADRQRSAGKSTTPSASSPPPKHSWRRTFPDYAALSNPRPLKVEDVQKLLATV